MFVRVCKSKCVMCMYVCLFVVLVHIFFSVFFFHACYYLFQHKFFFFAMYAVQSFVFSFSLSISTTLSFFLFRLGIVCSQKKVCCVCLRILLHCSSSSLIPFVFYLSHILSILFSPKKDKHDICECAGSAEATYAPWI